MPTVTCNFRSGQKRKYIFRDKLEPHVGLESLIYFSLSVYFLMPPSIHEVNEEIVNPMASSMFYTKNKAKFRAAKKILIFYVSIIKSGRKDWKAIS